MSNELSLSGSHCTAGFINAFNMLCCMYVNEFVFCCHVLQYLRDQTDMLVVGVIGLQGSGKSTIMSLLSANTPEEDQR